MSAREWGEAGGRGRGGAGSGEGEDKDNEATETCDGIMPGRSCIMHSSRVGLLNLTCSRTRRAMPHHELGHTTLEPATSCRQAPGARGSRSSSTCAHLGRTADTLHVRQSFHSPQGFGVVFGHA